jgi:hypothetical protein
MLICNRKALLPDLGDEGQAMSNFSKLEKEIEHAAKGSSLSWGRECAKLIEASILLCNTDAGDEVCGLFYNRIVDSYFVAARKTGDKFLRTYQGMPQIHQATGCPSLAMMVRTDEGHFSPRGVAFLMESDTIFSVRIKYRDEVRMACRPRDVRWFASLMRNPVAYAEESAGLWAGGHSRVQQKVPALCKPPVRAVASAFNVVQRGMGDCGHAAIEHLHFQEALRQRGR